MAQINQYVVRGYKRIEYVKRSTGQQVNGFEVYLETVQPDETVFGDQLEAVYLSGKYSQFVPALGVCVRKVYNQYGRVEDLIEI